MKTCPKCNNSHDKPGMFCSRSCANARTFNASAIQRKSESAKLFRATEVGKSIVMANVARATGRSRSPDVINRQRLTIAARTEQRFNQGLIAERSALRKILSRKHGYKCANCNIAEWDNKPITLQVDHIDGNAGNNKPDNLRLICPNCHSQTDSFGGRNKGSGRKARGISLG